MHVCLCVGALKFSHSFHMCMDFRGQSVGVFPPVVWSLGGLNSDCQTGQASLLYMAVLSSKQSKPLLFKNEFNYVL